MIANHVGDFRADLVWLQIGRGLAQVGEWEVVGCFGGDYGASGGSDGCRGHLEGIGILPFGPEAPFGFLFLLEADSLKFLDGAVGGGFGFGFVLVEIVIFPDVLLERSVGDVSGIENDVVSERLEIGHAEIGAGGLQSIKKEAGGFVLDLLGDKQAHDLHESDLYGVGVLEDGKNEGGNATAGTVGAELDAFVLKAFVEKAEAVAAESGRPALGAIDFEMLTAVGIICHEGPSLSPGDLVESSG